jgi:hypothetical protein
MFRLTRRERWLVIGVLAVLLIGSFVKQLRTGTGETRATESAAE